MSDGDYERDGWRPSWKPPAMSTEHLASLPDRDDRAADPVPIKFTPVETTTGNEQRFEALRVLAARNLALLERGNRQRLTGVEQREYLGNQAATHTLERMAPVSELIPPRAGDLFNGA